MWYVYVQAELCHCVDAALNYFLHQDNKSLTKHLVMFKHFF